MKSFFSFILHLRLWIVSTALFWGIFVHAGVTKKLAGIDSFGSDFICTADILNSHGKDIERLAEDWGADSNWTTRRAELENRIKNSYKLEFVGLSFINYFNEERETYLTIDLVHKEDSKVRMPFFEIPKGVLEDPEGLLELWNQYISKAFDLQKKGEFSFPQNCPAWHCTHGFEHEELKSYLKIFDNGARKHKEKLFEILRSDSRAHYRAHAAFILAHIEDPIELRNRLLPFRRDPSELVRNNVLRVFSDLASNHPKTVLPLEPFIEAVFYPTTLDRNKSLATLAALVQKEDNKKPIQEKLGPTLLKILRLKQPNNRDFAYQILKELSGKEYAIDDFSKWEKWLAGKK